MILEHDARFKLLIVVVVCIKIRLHRQHLIFMTGNSGFCENSITMPLNI